MTPEGFIVGFVACLALVLLYLLIEAWKESYHPKIPEDIANDIVGETPKCPDCGCYDLKLIDLTDRLPWLKEHRAEEIDYYECQKCHRVFNDETWKLERSYSTPSRIED